MNKKCEKLLKVGKKLGKATLSVAETILMAIFEEIEDMQYMRSHSLAVIGRDVRSMRYESEELSRLHEEKMKRQAVKRLAERKYIKLRKDGDRVVYKLTTNGKIMALKFIIAKSEKYFEDDRMCIVLFDFPEVANTARVHFRRFLKNVGFKFVQGSVWSTKKNVNSEIIHMVGLLKIASWVEVYEARQ